jgi:hypothetical protein
MIDYSLILSTNYPTAQWSLAGDSYDGLTWLDSSAKPTQAELDALWPSTQDAFAKNVCKNKASELLYATDWTTIADVTNPANSPYLTNQDAFIAYRNALRKLAVNPVDDPVWPTLPTATWA